MDDKKWELFKDRVESLLERWDNYHSRQPNASDESIIRNCLAEINDDFTKGIIESKELKK